MGLIPYWCKDPKGGRKPINAKAETVAKLPMFRDAYAQRRCILPVDGFFEWKAIEGTKGKQPFAIAMRDGSPFGMAGVWENWKDPAGEWRRTFAILTVPPNELIAQIHDRMPAILRTQDYDRWLGDEANPMMYSSRFRRTCCACGQSRRASVSPRTMTPRYSTRFPRRPPEVYIAGRAVKRSLVSPGSGFAWTVAERLSAVSTCLRHGQSRFLSYHEASR
jgi:putative SOS response-associated peptidase YedK